ncbi:hypothetical protein BJ741DRAFT_691186 [Chytriomyces cf. hyalinus JEL632]|nr:hypothetical protein BJ741DRAFT_691186 [Chytriomyces cf. hyalinus JEL632]
MQVHFFCLSQVNALCGWMDLQAQVDGNQQSKGNMSTLTASSDCTILSAWLPTVFSTNCCNVTSNCTTTGGVTRLDLDGKGISGALPTQLGLLTSLAYMTLFGNQLTGTIPTELARLTNLSDVSLYENKLSGTIPTELGRLTKLTNLRLDSNNLNGTFPCELSNLTALRANDSNNFTGNPLLVSTNFNAAELSQSCKTALLQTATRPATAKPTNSNPGASVDQQQQQSIAPIIGGVVGAAAVLAIMVAMGICIGGDVETSTAFPLSSIPPPSEYSSAASERGATVDDFLVASQVPQSVTAPLFDRHELLPYDQKSAHHQDGKIETLASLKASMPEQGAYIVQSSMTALEEKKALDEKSKDLSKSQFNLMLSSEGHGSSSSLLSLPADPKNWTEDETAEWILERFGNAQLSSLALSKTS